MRYLSIYLFIHLLSMYLSMCVCDDHIQSAAISKQQNFGIWDHHFCGLKSRKCTNISSILPYSEVSGKLHTFPPPSFEVSHFSALPLAVSLPEAAGSWWWRNAANSCGQLGVPGDLSNWSQPTEQPRGMLPQGRPCSICKKAQAPSNPIHISFLSPLVPSISSWSPNATYIPKGI